MRRHRAGAWGVLAVMSVFLGNPALAQDAPSLTSLCLAALPAVEPQSLLAAWSLSPIVLLPLLAVLPWYARRLGHVSRSEAGAFALGWLLLAAALVSPLCRMAASLASAHMVQHVILVALAPPLLLLGTRSLARPAPHLLQTLLRPTAASALYAGAIWLSHLRPVYEAALIDPIAHVATVAVLLAAALIFWASLMAGAVSGAAMMIAFGALLQTGVLGALLTFARHPWYPLFGDRPLFWGLTPLEDQQLAGLIMWIPMGSVYLAAGLVVLAGMLARLEQSRR